MRDEYGDYCCAMGVWYGYCGDRFLVTNEAGQQLPSRFATVKVMLMMVRVNTIGLAVQATESVS